MGAQTEVWCDGACSGNPGPGGWAAAIITRDAQTQEILEQQEMSGGAKETTNNRMEMIALIVGLSALPQSTHVLVHIDSQYVMDGFEKGWVKAWKRNGWRTRNKQPVKNQELWERLEAEVSRHQVSWVKVKGHAGVGLNERVDQLAVQACIKHGGRQAQGRKSKGKQRYRAPQPA